MQKHQNQSMEIPIFPSMLPWLFPYGLGGIGQTEHKYKLSSMSIATSVDVLWQAVSERSTFPTYAFNHDNEGSTTAGYLTAEKSHFMI